MNTIQEILSSNIAKYRERIGYSQFKLAAESEVSQSYINSIESGLKYPSAKTLEKICSALHIKPFMLFLENDDLKDFEKITVLNEIRDKILNTMNEDINKIFDESL